MPDPQNQLIESPQEKIRGEKIQQVKMILAIETATNVCSVVFRNRNGKFFRKRSETKGSHSEKMFFFIDQLMKEHSFRIADLDAVLISEGPGSYTGLRIGASGVKGLLFGSSVALYAVNTLASFAMAAVKKNAGSVKIHSIIDAKRKHFYYQQFIFDKKLKDRSAVQTVPIVQFEEKVKESEVIIGTGLKRVQEKVKNKAAVFGEQQVSAESLIELYHSKNSEFTRKVKPEEFSPRYYNQRKEPQVKAD